MTKTIRSASRYLPALLLILALLFGVTPAACASVLGEAVDGYTTEGGGSLALSRNVFWTGSDFRTENYITYQPDGEVVPVVVYGSKLLNYGDFPSMAALLEKEGYTVLGGINGDFYNTADYQPLGIVISEGELRSSDGGYWAVGFTADGETRIGKPALNMTVEIADQSYPLAAVNKARKASGLTLFTEDHSYTTQANTPGINVVLAMPRREALTVDCRLKLEVLEVIRSAEPLELTADELVLSLAETGDPALFAALASLQAGDTIKIDIRCADGWQDIEYAVGAMRKLVSNGQVESGLDASAQPRSAVGLQADGSLILYTVDGRQSGHSIGASLPQVAERLIELGCVEAAVMDGGGSTTLNALYLGDGSVSQINSPSDGRQRSVTNYIMLVSKAESGGAARKLALSPFSLHILSGGSAQFTAQAANADGLQAAEQPAVYYSVRGDIGSIDANGLFTAGNSGSGEVVAGADGIEPVSVPVTVISQPDEILLFTPDGAAGEMVEVPAGGTLDLQATAYADHIRLVADDSCFTWNVLGEIGQIDANGLFTAGKTRAEGMIAASAAGASASCGVRIVRAGSFDDVTQADWYYQAVEFVAREKLLSGTAEYIFSPQLTMNRAMLVTALHRMAGLPASSSGASFSDVAADTWYTAAVGWAAENRIVTGYNGRFTPLDAVTREQIAVILYQYAQAAGMDISAAGDLSLYPDAADISSWAVEAMRWAVGNGLIGNRGNEGLAPAAAATRAEAALILMRFHALAN